MSTYSWGGKWTNQIETIYCIVPMIYFIIQIFLIAVNLENLVDGIGGFTIEILHEFQNVEIFYLFKITSIIL